MNNKISNTNFENEKRLNNFIEAYKQTKEQEFIVGSINKDFFFEFVDCLLAELEQKDKRIQELEEELEKANRQLDLDYVDDNYITKEKVKELEEESKKVLDLIFEYGQIDGVHHKMWVIDQIVRILTKDKYNEWIKNYVYDEETGDIYDWDKGIAP